MRTGPLSLLLAAASGLALAPLAAEAQLVEVLRSPPPLDRHLELELRGYYLAPDDYRLDVRPADSLTRGRLEDVRERTAYRYAKRAGDAVLHRTLRGVPLLLEFEEYFRELARFEFLGPDQPLSGSEAAPVFFEPPHSGLGRLETWTGVRAEFALRIGIDRITPGLELRREPLRGRLSYDVTRDRLETVLEVPTGLPLQLELSHRAWLGEGEYEVGLAAGFAF